MKAAPPCCLEPLEARIAPAFAPVFDLSALDGSTGFRMNGLAARDFTGSALGTLGDINGDGFDDFIVAAASKSAGGLDFAGVSYVVFGRNTGFPAALDLSTLDGTNGFRIHGEAEKDYAGVVATGAGDMNGDGFDDVLIGAPAKNANGTYSGAAYVIFGKASGFPAVLNLASLDGTTGFQINGVAAFDNAGNAGRSAGDVNGDGFDDIILGAQFADPNGGYSGSAYVVFGKSTAFPATLELSSLDGMTGFRLDGEAANDYAGFSVSGAGDVNGDGFDDVIVGAHKHAITNTGAAYVVFGKASGFPATRSLGTLSGTDGFKATGTTLLGNVGYSVSGAGDVNGDGFDDIIIGAPGENVSGQPPGEAFVIFGKSQPFAAAINLSTLDGTTGFRLLGEASLQHTGFSVNRAGDFNGDGLDDLIIGANWVTNQSFREGSAYLIFGRTTAFPATLALAKLDGTTGFELQSKAASGYAGYAVSSAGDIDGDGFDDVLIGAPYANSNGLDAGTAYLVFGSDGTGSPPASGVTIARSGKSATFTDVDGDKVTVKISKGKFTLAMFETRPEGLGFQLERLDLTDPLMASAKLTFKAKPQQADTVAGKDGDNMVNVGALTAAFGLGKVKLPGDLGRIDLGAVKSLSLVSLGKLGVTTQDTTAPSLVSRLAGDLGKLTVQDDVTGGATLAIGGRLGVAKIGGDFTQAVLRVLGVLQPVTPKDALAIKALTIGGEVAQAAILAGHNLAGSAANADVQIGTVLVQGAWTASNLVAGLADSTADGFGRNDTLIAGGTGSILSQIASLTIRGNATGSVGAGDHFGIAAEVIKKAKIGGIAVALTEQKDDLLLDATNGDFRLLEV